MYLTHVNSSDVGLQHLSGNALDDEQGRKLPPELHQLLRLLWQHDPGHPLVDIWKRHIWSFFRTPTGWPSGGGIIVWQIFTSRPGTHQQAQLPLPPHSNPTLVPLVLVILMLMWSIGAKERQSFHRSFPRAFRRLLLKTQIQSKMGLGYPGNFSRRDDISFQYFTNRLCPSSFIFDTRKTNVHSPLSVPDEEFQEQNKHLPSLPGARILTWPVPPLFWGWFDF